MEELLSFIKQFPRRHFEKDQLFLAEGHASESVYVIVSGFAKVHTIDASGNEQLLWIAGRSDITPTESFFTHRVDVRFMYTAMTPLVAYEVDKRSLLKFAEEAPLVMKEIAHGLAEHYDDLLYRVSSIAQASARDKLIYVLHNVATRFSSSKHVDFNELGLKLTHKDIASLMHASRETASIELSQLRDDGAITYDRANLVVNSEKLGQLLEG